MQGSVTSSDSMGFIDQHHGGAVLLKKPKPSETQVNISKGSVILFIKLGKRDLLDIFTGAPKKTRALSVWQNYKRKV